MSEQKRLALTLTVEMTVPLRGVDFNNMISAFQGLAQQGVAPLFEAALQAIEQEAGEFLMAEEPGRFAWHGCESKKPKRWVTPFGEVHHRFRRMRDYARGDTFSPLRAALMIPPRKQLTWPVLVGPVALASELSFRKAAKEGRRLQGEVGPSKSSTWLYFQQFSQAGLDPRKPAEERTLEVAVADGTKLKLQDRGRSIGTEDLRIVLSQKREGGPFQVAAFDLGKTWPQLKKRLLIDFPGQSIEALLVDGEERTEVLADPGTWIQRCLVHGPRGLDMAMYLDKMKKTRRDWILELFADARAWHIDQAALRELPEKERSYLRELVVKAEENYGQILESLPKRAFRARYYVERFVQNAISYLLALLHGEEALPAVTTNAIENVFSQMAVRLKRIGRRWSPRGALNMVRVLLTKALNSEYWQEYLELFTSTPGAVQIECRVLPWRWIES